MGRPVTNEHGTSVLAHAAWTRVGGAILVLLVLWLAVAWAVAVP
jgi:hypothetical protein